jgi:hypothetical protein
MRVEGMRKRDEVRNGDVESSSLGDVSCRSQGVKQTVLDDNQGTSTVNE